MFLAPRKLGACFILLGVSVWPTHAQENSTSALLAAPPTYQEIPYYIRKLKEAQTEGKRLEFNKKIHDGVAHADLSKRKVVKRMRPMMAEIQSLIDSGLDRPSLAGNTMWLQSAVRYFNIEKYRKKIEIPKEHWYGPQVKSLNGVQIFTYPDKILINEGQGTLPLIESSNIFEAILSPGGRTVAFFREKKSKKKKTTEIWALKVRKRKERFLAEVPSCYTMLFSLNGKRVYFQEKPEKPGEESLIGFVSARGGKIKNFTRGVLLDTIVKSGKYKGHILIKKKKIHHLGLADRHCLYAYDQSGREKGRLINIPCE